MSDNAPAPDSPTVAPAADDITDDAAGDATDPEGVAQEVGAAEADAPAPETATEVAAPAPEPATQVAAPAPEPATQVGDPAPEPAAQVADPAPEPPADVASPAPDAQPVETPAAAPGAVKSRGKPRLKLEDLTVGTETKGKVVGMSKFGAFVDIGAVTDGLVHISELSDKRVTKVEEVVTAGQSVDVWIKEVDIPKSRISLSMKRRANRPMESLKVGQVLMGKVTSITKYGAFVDIGAETEGLVHVSEMSSGFVDNPRDFATPGQEVEVRIKEVDKKRERISLSMADLKTSAKTEMSSGAPEERQPTVVELALRKALGQLDDDEEGPADDGAARSATSKSRGTDIGEVYARMLAEYREQSDS